MLHLYLQTSQINEALVRSRQEVTEVITESSLRSYIYSSDSLLPFVS